MAVFHEDKVRRSREKWGAGVGNSERQKVGRESSFGERRARDMA